MKEKYILTLVFLIIIVSNSKIVFTSVEQIDATITIGDETSVTNTNPTNQQDSGSSSSSRKSGKTEQEKTEEKCKENWICTEWRECINNIQTMSCYDSNACNTFKMMPQLERKCDKIIQNEYPKNEEIPKNEEKTRIINNIVGTLIVTIIIANLLLLYIQKNKRKNKRKGI